MILTAPDLRGDPDGDGAITGYQWLRNGTAIEGANAASLDTSSTGYGSYSTVISNSDAQGFSSSITTEPVFVENPKLTALSGTITTWNGQLLADTTLNITRQSIDASADGAIQLRDFREDASNGTITMSLWADTGSAGLNNFNFTILKGSDPLLQVILNSDVVNSTWLTSINENEESYSVSSAFLGNNGNPGASGSIRIADLILTAADPQQTTNLPSLTGGRVGSTTLQTASLGTLEQRLVNGGVIDTAAPRGSALAGVSRDPLTGMERQAINSADTLMALRLSSGALTSTDLTSQSQWLAADVDQNGFVQAKDAWLINQYVVGAPVAGSSVGQWEFIDSQTSLDGLSATQALPQSPSTLINTALNASQQTLSITGILNGDIDGSYSMS